MSEFFNWEDFWNLVGAGVALVLILGVLTILGKWIFAENKVKYCMIEDHTNYNYRGEEKQRQWIKLVGQVDWRPNQDLGYFASTVEAIEAAEKMGCPLNVGQK